MLVLDAGARLTADGALAHSYFDSLRDPEDCPVPKPYDDSYDNATLPLEEWKREKHTIHTELCLLYFIFAHIVCVNAMWSFFSQVYRLKKWGALFLSQEETQREETHSQCPSDSGSDIIGILYCNYAIYFPPMNNLELFIYS